MATRSQAPFAPWRKGLIGGSALIAVGVGTFLIASKAPLSLPGVATGAALALVGSLWFKSGLVRWNGKQVEKSSIRALKLPPGWSASSNVALSKGGDADLVITTDVFRKFAVEIKSHESAVIKRAFLGLGQARILNGGGKDVGRQAVQQALHAAESLNGEPVLWYPVATEADSVQIKGVLVVTGPAKHLVKVLRRLKQKL